MERASYYNILWKSNDVLIYEDFLNSVILMYNKSPFNGPLKFTYFSFFLGFDIIFGFFIKKEV